MPKGYLILILHAHLPFVRHPEHDVALEEDWLFEAITETYLPILDKLETLADEKVKFKLTMSLSPTLIEMLEDEFLMDRYLEHLEKLIELAQKELERTMFLPRFHDLALMYHDRFRFAHRLFTGRYAKRIIPAFKELKQKGCLEIITCAATHAYLPLLAINENVIRAQIKTACAHYESVFDSRPEGIWLPECGFAPELEKHLKDEGVKYFFTDAHGLLHGEPRPARGVFAPTCTTNGMSVFARDMESSREVWSSKVGYPGDPCYRDFYRDIGYDLECSYLEGYTQPTGHRKMTGIKYYRITGATDDKEVYEPKAARKKTAEHAADFIARRKQQAELTGEFLDRPPVMVAPYDAELFGHWWFEGPEFLDSLFRGLSKQDDIELITAPDYLKLYPENQTVEPSRSSWGLFGHNEMWLHDSNDWIYRHLHKAGDRMVELATRYPEADGTLKRALNQAARELMLSQSSDWAFIMKSGTTTQYAVQRVKEHIIRFTRLYVQIGESAIDEKGLKVMEQNDNIFADIDYHVYL
jgi:1,4-alpha-glucan branching enzyme